MKEPESQKRKKAAAIFGLLFLLLTQAAPAEAKISAYHTPGAVVFGSATDTCTGTITGALQYYSAYDSWCYCNGTLWEPFSAGELPSPTAYWKIDDGSGTTVTDSIAADNGTTHNSPTWITGFYNGALQFNGTNQYVTIPDNAVIHGSTYTISLWFQFLGTSANTEDILAKGYLNAGDKSYEVFMSGDGSGWGFYSNNGGGVANTTPLNPAYWYHLVVSKSGTTVNLYTNGALDTGNVFSPYTATTSYDTTPLDLGAFSTNSGTVSQYLNGKVDDVRFYNVALTAAQIQTLYNSGRRAACP